MARTSKKARRRRQQAQKRGGVFTGMRRGFKNLAGTEKSQQPKKSSWLGTALTVLLLLAAIGLFFYRAS